MNNFKEKMGIGVLVVAILSGTLVSNPVQCLFDNDDYILAPVEDVVASDFENSKQTPETVVYSEDADHFIISYETEDLPEHFTDNEKYSCTEIAEELEDIPLVKDKGGKTFVEDDNFISE